MKKNPKMIAGIAALVFLLGGLIYMATRIIPMAGRVREEMAWAPTPVPAPPDTIQADPSRPTPGPELSINASGTEVEELQTRLKELGYYQGDIDGGFGKITRDAVKEFQRVNQLTPDGIVGDRTREALFSENAVPNPGQGENP